MWMVGIVAYLGEKNHKKNCHPVEQLVEHAHSVGPLASGLQYSAVNIQKRMNNPTFLCIEFRRENMHGFHSDLLMEGKSIMILE